MCVVFAANTKMFTLFLTFYTNVSFEYLESFDHISHLGQFKGPSSEVVCGNL